MTLEQMFGSILCQVRKSKNISQEQLGSLSGYHRTYVSLLERGHKSPSLVTIFKLAEALDIKASLLIEQVEVGVQKDTDQDENI